MAPHRYDGDRSPEHHRGNPLVAAAKFVARFWPFLHVVITAFVTALATYQGMRNDVDRILRSHSELQVEVRSLKHEVNELRVKVARLNGFLARREALEE